MNLGPVPFHKTCPCPLGTALLCMAAPVATASPSKTYNAKSCNALPIPAKGCLISYLPTGHTVRVSGAAHLKNFHRPAHQIPM